MGLCFTFQVERGYQGKSREKTQKWKNTQENLAPGGSLTTVVVHSPWD